MSSTCQHVDTIAYEALETDESTETTGSSRRQRNSQMSRKLMLSAFATTLGAAALIFILRSSAYPTTQSNNICGASFQEARTGGCRFDLMSFSWLPPACFDEELTKEFEMFEPWKWFADPGGTQEVAKSDVLKGETDVLFVSFAYHRAHCTFMWKKLHRAIGTGGFIDSYIGNYNHTAHCEHMLLMGNEALGTLNTQIVTKYPSCDSRGVQF